MMKLLRMQARRQRLKNRVRVNRPRRAARVRHSNRQRRDTSSLAVLTPRRLPSIATSRAPARFQPAARIVCRSAPPVIVENAAAGAEAPPPLPTDDIDRAYGDECAAIMREFANRMAGARSQGERRAIKSARRSALAAAKEKAKRAKAARRDANAAARQTAHRPPSRPSRPEPRPG
ncbi:MAG: hypothetical protein JO110_06370 [Acetobacteraceae bacterium]|nr:hypothetical protein [Acetobacteraceae bacterium]